MFQAFAKVIETESVQHKQRISAADRRRQRRVRIKESDADAQERQTAIIIRESDAIAGFERFHGVHLGSDLSRVTASSAGVLGWARYERKAQMKLLESEPHDAAPVSHAKPQPIAETIPADVVEPGGAQSLSLAGASMEELEREIEKRNAQPPVRPKSDLANCCGPLGCSTRARTQRCTWTR